MTSDHYYFHIVENGLSIPDDEGMILSAPEAHDELQNTVRELTIARMRGGRGPGDGVVQLTDCRGHIIETLSFRNVLN